MCDRHVEVTRFANKMNVLVAKVIPHDFRHTRTRGFRDVEENNLRGRPVKHLAPRVLEASAPLEVPSPEEVEHLLQIN